jgi:hypothetical protein
MAFTEPVGSLLQERRNSLNDMQDYHQQSLPFNERVGNSANRQASRNGLQKALKH